MRFADSDTQKLLRDTARSYLRDRYPWDRLYAIEQGGLELAAEELAQFAELGWLGLLAPDTAGGSGLSLLEAAVVIDEIGYAAAPAPIAGCNIVARLLALAGGPAAAEHLSSLVAGKRLYTLSEHTRRNGEQTAGGAPMLLTPAGGHFTAAGSLPLVPFGRSADYVLAPALAGGEPALALVSLRNARREPVQALDRLDYCNLYPDGATAEMVVTGPRAEELLGLCDTLTTAFCVVQMAGMMQRVLEMTGEYISNRVQFGQPVAKFQAARHHAADLLMLTESMRWTAYHAVWRLQQDVSDSAGVWLARHWAIRAAQKTFEITHLLHGGVGVGLDYPLHLHTLGLAALAVRCGRMDEMVSRVLEALGLDG